MASTTPEPAYIIRQYLWGASVSEAHDMLVYVSFICARSARVRDGSHVWWQLSYLKIYVRPKYSVPSKSY